MAVRWRSPGVADAALAALVVASVVAVSTQIEPEAGSRSLDAAAYGAMVLAGGALGLRRRAPLLGVVVVGVALAAYLARDYPGGPVWVTLFVALYAAAAARPWLPVTVAATTVVGALVVVGEVAGTGPGLLHLLFVGWSAASVFLGAAVRSRRQEVAALAERTRQAEQSREDEARRRVAEERLRIARDLHDSVAHAMATIAVQSGVAVHLLGEGRPADVADALAAIRHASGEVLDELGAVLGLLRDGGQPAARAPLPGAGAVADLVEGTRRSGLDVALEVEGDLASLTPPVGGVVYRIVQESLTNVVRHAGARARATVTVVAAPDRAPAVSVVDDGSPNPGGATPAGAGGALRLEPGDPGSPGSGVGILGMRERVEATGGHLEAGPRPGGGFAVRARWDPPS